MGGSGRGKHRHRAAHVDVVHEHGILERARHGGDRSQVHHTPCAGGSLGHPLRVAYVADQKIDLAGAVCEVLALAGREVVQHAHAVAGGEQRVHEMRADETGATGDEHGAGHEPNNLLMSLKVR